MIARVKTGIKGLDELVGGGFPASSCLLVSGKIVWIRLHATDNIGAIEIDITVVDEP